jgi:hypothetical protein
MIPLRWGRWSPKRWAFIYIWHGLLPEKILSSSVAVKTSSLTRLYLPLISVRLLIHWRDPLHCSRSFFLVLYVFFWLLRPGVYQGNRKLQLNFNSTSTAPQLNRTRAVSPRKPHRKWRESWKLSWEATRLVSFLRVEFPSNCTADCGKEISWREKHFIRSINWTGSLLIQV